MTDKLQAWCESVLREYYPRGLRNEIYVEYANVLAAVLRKRTDFRLVEPLPEGAIPVRIYACVDDRCIFVDTDGSEFCETNTHRSIIETHILPRVKTPIVNAEPKGVE